LGNIIPLLYLGSEPRKEGTRKKGMFQERC